MNDFEALTLVLVPENSSFSERRVVIVNQPIPVGRASDTLEAFSTSFVKFNSSVVSRQHCRFLNLAGKFFIQDTKSSSGTFLNGERLSPARTESRQFELHDGDIIRLGETIQQDGATHRAIEMRVCLPRPFNESAAENGTGNEANESNAMPENDLQAVVDNEFESIWNSLVQGLDTPMKRIRAAARVLALTANGGAGTGFGCAQRNENTINSAGGSGGGGGGINSSNAANMRSDVTISSQALRSDVTISLPSITRTLTNGSGHEPLPTTTPLNKRASTLPPPPTTPPTISPSQTFSSSNDGAPTECMHFIEKLSWESPELKSQLMELAKKSDGQLIAFFKSLKGAPNSFVNVTTKYAKSIALMIELRTAAAGQEFTIN